MIIVVPALPRDEKQRRTSGKIRARMPVLFSRKVILEVRRASAAITITPSMLEINMVFQFELRVADEVTR